MKPRSWTAVIVAAGRGTRFGRPKQLLEIAGRPMIAWSLRAFAEMREIEALIVVTEEEILAPMAAVCAEAAREKCRAVVRGGATRQASVYAGLNALPAGCEAVLVHDGARPLVDPELVRAGMAQAGEGRAALLAVPIVDTVKLTQPGSRRVQETVPRDRLWAAQTPQFALAGDMRRAHEAALRDGFTATDDAMLLERIGVSVTVVESSPDNFKVTLPEDLAHAADLLHRRLASAMK